MLYRTNKDIAEYNAAMLVVAEAVGADGKGRVSVHDLHGVAATMAPVSDIYVCIYDVYIYIYIQNNKIQLK